MDWSEVREQFPITKEHIFFDLANKAALPLFATKVIEDYIQKQQVHAGDKAEWFSVIEQARSRAARLLGAAPDEIALLKNTSEGLNIAAAGLGFKPGDNVIVNTCEHPNNIYCWLNLERQGVEVRWAPTEKGEVTVESLAKVVDEKTKAVALSMVTFAPGNRNDVKAISELCTRRNIYTIIDAVQATGTLRIDVKALGVDLLSTSAHKALFVPHGVGFLYCRRDLLRKIQPLYVARASMGSAASVKKGGQSFHMDLSPTASRFEIGNNNYLGISVLNRNLEFLLDLGMERVEKRILMLSGHLCGRLSEAGYRVLGPVDEARRSAIVCFEVNDPEGLHAWLMERGVITTMRGGALRVALGIYNTRGEIDRFMELMAEYAGGQG